MCREFYTHCPTVGKINTGKASRFVKQCLVKTFMITFFVWCMADRILDHLPAVGNKSLATSL